MRRLFPLALALAVVVLSAAAGPAAARTGPCLLDGSGPRCQIWSGKVTFVADGDTLDVDIKGDGTRKPRRIRVTGIQAMELSRYSKYAARRRGECHGVAAANRVDRLFRRSRGKVRIAAHDRRSHSGSRTRRSVAFRIGGRWVDLGATLLREGHAVWLPNPVEWAWNRSYSRLAENAAARHIRIWDTEACHPGPDAPVALSVNWDADGNDFENPNGEWFEIANRGARTISLAGWWVRDSALRRFRFPAGATVAPGDSVKVRVGRGSATGSTFFWGLPAPTFENASYDARGIGDGGYLFDPDGDLRAWSLYR